jgi:hypothetical protein
MKNKEISKSQLERLTYRPLELAAMCGISKNLAYNIIHSGQIRTIRAGKSKKSILLPASAINDFLSTAISLDDLNSPKGKINGARRK